VLSLDETDWYTHWKLITLIGNTHWKHSLETLIGNTHWKHSFETLETLIGNTHSKHSFETLIRNTHWKHSFETLIRNTHWEQQQKLIGTLIRDSFLDSLETAVVGLRHASASTHVSHVVVRHVCIKIT